MLTEYLLAATDGAPGTITPVSIAPVRHDERGVTLVVEERRRRVVRERLVLVVGEEYRADLDARPCPRRHARAAQEALARDTPVTSRLSPSTTYS